MKISSLYVEWKYGQEVIELEDIYEKIKQATLINVENSEFSIKTLETRNTGDIAEYSPSVSFKKSQKGIIGFSLQYKDGGFFFDGSDSELLDAEGETGTAVYKLEDGKWSCAWIDATGKHTFSPVVFEARNGALTREMVSAKRSLRDQKFRNAVYLQDKQCVITGEQQYQALDAAHIIEVKSDGVDLATNGIMLRKDLHALFDANLFDIKPDGTIEILSELGKNYAELLKAAQHLSSFKKACRRVEKALKIRQIPSIK
jgi:HNH endonuclease